MRRAALLALMISLVLCLSACGGRARCEEAFESWRNEFVSAESHTMIAEVTAIAEESETVFVLRYEGGAEEHFVEVIEPKMIAGIKARIDGEENKLNYDGTLLALGGESDERSSPMMALPLMMKLIYGGHLESAWTESFEGDKALVSELENGDGVRIRLWLDEENMQPRFAAIRSGERAELKIHIQTME